MKIFPSLISSDLLDLRKTLCELDDHVAGYHLDIMDNHFVPNLTWGPAFIEALGKATNKPFHLHLMVTDPFAWLQKCVAREGDVFIFHYEAVMHKDAIESEIKKVRVAGFKVGMAINPKTEIDSVFPYVHLLDAILIMSVEPGFSGQAFLPDTFTKIKALVDFKRLQQLLFAIVIDGGVNLTNIKELFDVGVEQFCVAAGIFSHKDHIQAIQDLYEKCQ